jgi:hypothetical protein
MSTYSFEIRQGTRSLVRINANSLTEAMELLAMNACEMCSEEVFEPEIKLVETLENEQEVEPK